MTALAIASKQELKQHKERLESELFSLQRAAATAKISTIILVEGFTGTGKQGLLRVLSAHLEPRALRAYALREPRGEEKRRPWLWRFWQKMPNYGELALFDGSWYRELLEGRISREMKREEYEARLSETRQLEKMLQEDGQLVIKLWMDLSEKSLRDRLVEADKDKEDFWDVQPWEWLQLKEYRRWKKVSDELLEQSGGWHRVDCGDLAKSPLETLSIINTEIKKRLGLSLQPLAEATAP